jgi:maleate isomerase
VITPSSNTNAEPLTYALLAEVPDVTAHFSRFALPPQLDVTVTAELLLPAATLLAEALVDALVFHGTSGSWRGIDGDLRLCGALEAATGIPTTTATLATLAAIRSFGSDRRIGLAFPGTAEIAGQIEAEYARHGISLVAVASDDAVNTNHQIAALSDSQVLDLIEAGCVNDADAVVVIGTNLRAAHFAAEVERALDVTVIDSAAATVWHLLGLAGIGARPTSWGRLFKLPYSS